MVAGLGQMYCGRLRRGLLLLALLLLLTASVLLFVLPTLPAPANVCLSALLLAAARVLIVGDAAVLARRRPARRPYNRWMFYAAYATAAWLSVRPVRAVLVQSFVIPGAAMAPALIPGDHIVVDKLWARLGEVDRGDVVVLDFPLDPAKQYVKRVIALPGETIEMHGSAVSIDGRTLDEPYLEDSRTSRVRFGPVVIPADAVFVMGDNRDNSSDSREWGALPLAALRGRVVAAAGPRPGIAAGQSVGAEGPRACMLRGEPEP